MSHELMYTSVPRGLRPGEHGFCVVAVTQGIPSALAAKLESLSSYRHLFPPSDRNAQLNPVLNSHLRVQVDGKSYHILSRIVDAGLDYSQRTNKFAHHLVLDRSELPAAGPAWLLLQPRLMESEWNGRDPQILPAGRRVPSGDAPPRPCRRWQEVMGDGGWGGVLASMTARGRPAYLIFQPGTDPLPLIAESLALLPAANRWDVTFSTYYLGLPPDVTCQWRCLAADTPEAESVLESNGDNVIVLDGNQGEAPDGPLVEAARTGKVERETAVPSRSARAASVPIAAPALPSADPVVHRQATNFPASSPRPKSVESAPMTSANASLAASRSGSLMTLALGLVLGLVLMLFCILPTELLSGRAISQLLGVPNKEETDLRAKLENAENELKETKRAVEELKRQASSEKNKQSPADHDGNDRIGRDSRPGGDVPAVGNMTLWQALARALRDARDQSLADANAQIQKLKAEKEDLARRNKELEKKEASRKDPPPAKETQTTPPAAQPKPEFDTLSLPSADQNGVQAKLTGIKKLAVVRTELLGLPDKVDEVVLKTESTGNDLLVKANGVDFATFHCGKNPAEEWQFSWGSVKSISNGDDVCNVLRLCMLKVSYDTGLIGYYGLQPSGTVLPVTLKSTVEKKRTTFRAKSPLLSNEMFDRPQGSLLLRTPATMATGKGLINFKMSGNRLVPENSKSNIEAGFDDQSLMIQFGDDSDEEILSLDIPLYRLFDGREVQVAVIRLKRRSQ